MIKNLRAAFITLVCAVMVLGSASVEAGSIVRDSFEFPKDRAVKIVVFRPDVRVGTMRTRLRTY